MFALTINTDIEVYLYSSCRWSLTKYSFETSYATQSPVISHQWNAVLQLGNTVTAVNKVRRNISFMNQIQHGRDLCGPYFTRFRDKALRVYVGFKKAVTELTANSRNQKVSLSLNFFLSLFLC